MALIRLDQACIAYGDHALLDHVDFAIEPGEKIGLVGRNGMGKSTLLRVLSGSEKLDSGVYNLASSAKVNYLPQELPPADNTTVFEYLAGGLETIGTLLSRYEQLTHRELDSNGLKELQAVQHEIELQDGWMLQQRLGSSLAELGLNAETRMKALSGGWRRRVSIARALISRPDLLLLDEPTNHLDIPAIDWLKDVINRADCAVVLITHDRRFLSEIAEKIVWLDRGKIMTFPGDFEKFLQGREEFLANEERQNALFDKRLAEEEKWIRQGIKARRTRNEGRVRALKELRKQRKARIDVKGNVKMQLEESMRSGKLVSELEHVNYSYEGKPVLKDVSLLVQRGDRIGIIGRNGAGKTTLLKLILGELQADSGTIRTGTKQHIAYFDQTRDQLNDQLSVADNLAEGREVVEINGQQKHVIGYLGVFLFAPQRVRSPASTLSGGEKNRLLLAKLFSKQANILVLDEPTNDLDIETLELLEELIDGFNGTVIVVSHDREFVDQIVTSTLFIDDNGYVYEYVGGYDDLLRQHGELWPASGEESQPENSEVTAEQKLPQREPEKPGSKPVKLSYKMQRELEQLPGLIEEAEQKIAAIEQQMSTEGFFQKPHDEVTSVTARLSEQQQLLEHYYSRWQELEN